MKNISKPLFLASALLSACSCTEETRTTATDNRSISPEEMVEIDVHADLAAEIRTAAREIKKYMEPGSSCKFWLPEIIDKRDDGFFVRATPVLGSVETTNPRENAAAFAFELPVVLEKVHLDIGNVHVQNNDVITDFSLPDARNLMQEMRMQCAEIIKNDMI